MRRYSQTCFVKCTKASLQWWPASSQLCCTNSARACRDAGSEPRWPHRQPYMPATGHLPSHPSLAVEGQGRGKSELCVCACAYTYTELHLAGWTPLFCLLCGVEAGQEAKSSPILLHVLLYYLVLQRLSQSPQTDFLAVCEKSHFRNIQLTYLCFQLLK